MEERAELSLADVQELLRDPSSHVRASTAGKLARSYSTQQLTGTERELAEEIFRLMLRDAEARVRQALAEQLKDDPGMPREIALTLARDVAEVARPILEFSAALTDEDLIEIVNAGTAAKQSAVARRAVVSGLVSDAIVRVGCVDAVAELMGNDGAQIAEASLQMALERFGTDARVNEPMVRRTKLPLAVAERLVGLVSESLQAHLVTRHDLTPDMAMDLLLQTRERATVGLAHGASREDVLALVTRLHDGGRLSETLVLRALCVGDLDFFECAMAVRVGIPVQNAYRLIHDQGGLGLERLGERSGYSGSFMAAARAAISVARELQFDGLPGDRERFRDRMAVRLLTASDSRLETATVNYLLKRIKATTPTLQAA